MVAGHQFFSPSEALESQCNAMAFMHIVVVESDTIMHSWHQCTSGKCYTSALASCCDGMDPSIQPIPFRFWVTAYSAQPGLERDMRWLKQCIHCESES